MFVIVVIVVVVFLAKSGARSYHMREQAELLIERMKSGKFCNWENDWKLVTFFIGVSSNSIRFDSIET